MLLVYLEISRFIGLSYIFYLFAW